MRVYEIMFIVDPRVSDEDVVTLTGEVSHLVEHGGGQVARSESWGRRKLAYPIQKVKEGKYVLLYVTTENGANPLPEVELRLKQNDKVLRYLTVRTDRIADTTAPPAPPAALAPVAVDAVDEEDEP